MPKKKIFDIRKEFQGHNINEFYIDETTDPKLKKYLDDIFKLTLENLKKDQNDWFKKYLIRDWNSPYEELTINKVINLNIFKFLCITETQYYDLPTDYQNNLSKFFMNTKISQAAIVGKRKELL